MKNEKNLDGCHDDSEETLGLNEILKESDPAIISIHDIQRMVHGCGRVTAPSMDDFPIKRKR